MLYVRKNEVLVAAVVFGKAQNDWNEGRQGSRNIIDRS